MKSLDCLSVDSPLWGRRKAEMVSEPMALYMRVCEISIFLNFSELGFLLKLLVIDLKLIRYLIFQFW